MDTTSDTGDEAKSQSKVGSVASTIIGEFCNALEQEEDLKDVASRLRRVVLDEGVFAEPAIRSALFPDAS